MSTWADLSRELDLWQADGRIATFWWRDDDATRPSPALDRLLELRRKHDVPVMIAVIPARAEAGLAARLAPIPEASVAQHGWEHLNHAPVGVPKAELGPHRPVAFMIGELARGQLVLDALFGTWLRVLVPPHNRIAPALAAALPDAGFVGLSAYGARATSIDSPIRVNAHVDIMNWTTRAFGGTEAALRLAVAHLQARRSGTADPDEPTGLLTHHLAHDEAAWRFADDFLEAVRTHPAARVVDARDLFGT